MADKLDTSPLPVLVLASASPRRAELLNSVGLDFLVHPTDIDESRRRDEPPMDYVRRLSQEKATAAASQLPGTHLVLGADTTVVIEDEVAGKPIDAGDATRMLRALSGKWHEVLTGVTLVQDNQWQSDVTVTRVRFANLSDAEIRWYVATGEPFGKAGAYAIQGCASLFVERIEGSYSNVVGLPLETVYRLAREFRVDLNNLIQLNNLIRPV
ncbi:MAG: Maf family protein [Acidobacteriota bacterium]